MATITLPPDGDIKQLHRVLRKADDYLTKYGLHDWKMVWTRAKTTAGECDRRNQAIRLSAPLMSVWTMEQCEDTILHEIAHALTPGQNHNAIWKAKCREIGADPSRTWGHNGERDLREHSLYVGKCPNGHEVHANRRPKIRKSCSKCASSFDERYLVTWRKRS